MLVFITSLRHPRNCNGDFAGSVRELLQATLGSVCNQSSPEFRVIVVGNPSGVALPRFEKTEYVTVDFPPPSDLERAEIGMDALRVDRGCKYVVGLLRARRYDPTHVMFFDADDFVSSRLASLVTDNPGHDGWFLGSGYVYDHGPGALGLLDGFHAFCGTSHIVKYTSFDLPRELPPDADQQRILASVDRHYLLKIIGSHRWIAGHLAERGAPLHPLPFLGAVYHVGHGENHTAKSGALATKPADLTDAIRAEFGLAGIERFAPARGAVTAALT